MMIAFDLRFWLSAILGLAALAILGSTTHVKGRGWLMAFILLQLVASTSYYLPSLLNRGDPDAMRVATKTLASAAPLLSGVFVAAWICLLAFVVKQRASASKGTPPSYIEAPLPGRSELEATEWSSVVKHALIIAEPTSAYSGGPAAFTGDPATPELPDGLIGRADRAMQLDGALAAFRDMRVGKESPLTDEIRKSVFAKLASEWSTQLHVENPDWTCYFETDSHGVRFNVIALVDKDALIMGRLSRNTGISLDGLMALGKIDLSAKPKN